MITISPRLSELLSRDPGLSARVNRSVLTFSEWLERSKIVFFPEYTDHGPKHIADVLLTSEQLIALSAWEVLTAADAAVIILATLLHDCAMHLTQDGFIRLVTGKTTLKPVASFDSLPWPDLWQNFVSEVKRFSETDNVRMFGTRSAVGIPDLEDWAEWTEKQRWLIGEFLRRYHPRLAHEIALCGFPAANNEALMLDEGLGSEFSDLVGLVARSHGLALRPCLDYLREVKQNVLRPEGAHAVFAMALLRIADYLQIDSQRAPTIQLRLQALRSQTSIHEWNKHKAVPRLDSDPQDAEARRVTVSAHEVKTIETFLGLKRLFSSIQQELDSTWAVLGEVYSRLTQDDLPLYKLGLRIRRLRSNLDQRGFLDKLPFLPESVHFRSADGKLFELLIEPLYGGNLDAGVRELIQNALDAVHELNNWRTRNPAVGVVTDPTMVADVQVDLLEQDGAEVLRVQDRGIGMDFDIIRNYYLTVGASYRQSARWKQENAGDDQKSTVLRTGYFGIGALAAFLLGDEVRVTTRRAGSEVGMQFTATLHAENIQMNVVECHVGTTIEVPLRTNRERPFWRPHFRYLLPQPTVQVDGVAANGNHPGLKDDGLPLWQRVTAQDGLVMFWSRKRHYHSRVAHNGLSLEHADRALRELWRGSDRLRILLPNLHILDKEGNAPKPYLDLSRSSFLQENFKPLEILPLEILKDFFAYLLVTADRSALYKKEIGNYPFIESVLADVHFEKNPQAYQHHSGCNPVVYTARGLVPLDGAVLTHLGIKSLFFLEKAGDANIENLLADGTCGILPCRVGFRTPENLLYSERSAGKPPGGLSIRCSNWLAFRPTSRDSSIGVVVSSSGVPRGGRLRSSKLVESVFGVEDLIYENAPNRDGSIAALEWVLDESDDVLPGRVPLDAVVQSFAESSNPSPLITAWIHFIGSWIIPYDATERADECCHAFATLKPFVNAWQQLRDKDRELEAR